MQLASELRRLSKLAKTDTYERVHDCYRLTISPLDDMPALLGFTLWEARPRGWMPILSGRVTDTDDLAITFCAAPSSATHLDALASFFDVATCASGTRLPPSDRVANGASFSR